MINFESANKGTWFWFDENNHDIGGICLRVCSSEKYDEIERLTVKHKAVFKRGVKYDDPTTNESLASKLRWDFCIVDWKGIQIDGVDVECNKENKIKLAKITDFIKFASDCLESLNEHNTAIDEARVKNSEDTSNGNVAQ